MQFETLIVSLKNHIAHIEFNRADKANALNALMWQEIRQAMQWVDATEEARVAIISGKGPHFCAGIDLEMLQGMQKLIFDKCPARMREKLRALILDLQDCLTSVEKCRKPVIAAIHGACVGAGLDLISACDLRYSTTDAHFCIKEIDLAMTADVGTLQRLPKLIAPGIVNELAFTGRKVSANEAHALNLVNTIYESQELMSAEIEKIAANIAEKSPLAIRGIKEMLVYARDHSVADGLNYVATWNAAMLLSNDMQEVMQAAKEKRKPVFHI